MHYLKKKSPVLERSRMCQRTSQQLSFPGQFSRAAGASEATLLSLQILMSFELEM